MPMTLIRSFRSTKASTRSTASDGVRTLLVMPGLDSLAQSYFLTQYLHWMLHAGATGRCILPNLVWASTEKQGWVFRMSFGACLFAFMAASLYDVLS
jgi:hypothetical protein